jgi:hypothetical protein
MLKDEIREKIKLKTLSKWNKNSNQKNKDQI